MLITLLKSKQLIFKTMAVIGTVILTTLIGILTSKIIKNCDSKINDIKNKYVELDKPIIHSKDKVNDAQLLMLNLLSFKNDVDEVLKNKYHYNKYMPQNCDSLSKKEIEDKCKIALNNKYFLGEGAIDDLEGWEVVDKEINPTMKSKKSFSAVTFKNKDNIVIAFRSSDSGVLNENIAYFLPFKTHPQAKYAIDYVKAILNNSNIINENSKIYLTGHLLGGYLAMYSLGTFLQDNKHKYKFVKATTFNSLDIGITDNHKVRKVLSSLTEDKLTHYRI